MSNFHCFAPCLIYLHYYVFYNSFPFNLCHWVPNFFWGFAFHIIVFLPWPSLLCGECPLHWFHYITLYPPTPHPFKLLFCLLIGFTFFCSIFFYVLWICKLFCPSSNKGCPCRLHNKCQPSSFTNDVCLLILNVISFFTCVCILSVHWFFIIKGWCWFFFPIKVSRYG